jgi:hypothetical protein
MAVQPAQKKQRIGVTAPKLTCEWTDAHGDKHFNPECLRKEDSK